MKKKIICLSGIDGVGKTTISKYLSEYLRNKGYKTEYRWMRFNHYTTKVINFIGKIIGLSYYEYIDEKTFFGYHEYYKSKVLSLFYFFTIYIDNILTSFFKIFLFFSFRNKILLIDRFIPDIIVDYIIDTKDYKFFNSWRFQLLVITFKKIFSNKLFFIYLEAPEEVIIKRKPELRHDKNLSSKIKNYKKTIKYLNKFFYIYTVDNSNSIEYTLKNIFEKIDDLF